MEEELSAEYFEYLEKALREEMEIARRARSKGLDPELDVEIPIAVDLAERVEKLVGIPGVATRIRELEAQGLSREEAALAIGRDFAEGRLGGKGTSRLDAIDMAIRTSVALLTEGVVAAPIEGIARVGLGKNDDGSEYLKVYYAGPIRSAGGTAQALSVLVADYVRRSMGIAPYRPTEEEIERYVEEIGLYKRLQHLQYTPSDDEIRMIIRNCPVCIDGEPTEEEEVSGYRDLPRVETNRVRGGIALVSAEGIALKRPKIKKHVSKLGIDGWGWLDALGGEKKDGGGSSEKFLRDLIAGRPVFSHPSRPGGFRLRYGRSRNTGLAAAGINPATMMVLNHFLAPGTQIKVEQPGKAAAVAPVSSIEGPTVRLVNGDVVRIDDTSAFPWISSPEALKRNISRIIDLGEILISFGDFMENNRPLAPASYTFEWWAEEFRRAGGDPEGMEHTDGRTAIQLSRDLGVPLHPDHTYLWHDITLDELDLLADAASEGTIDGDILLMDLREDTKEILEKLLVQHKIRDGRIMVEDARPLLLCLGVDESGRRWRREDLNAGDALSAVNQLSGLVIRARAPTRIGCRMGRPEKSDRREMRPPPHVLFPTGSEGGKSRLVNEAAEHGFIEAVVERRRCPSCGKEGFAFRCECGAHTERVRACPSCGVRAEEKCPRCGTETSAATRMRIDVKGALSRALESLGERADNIRGVMGLTSRDSTPEPLEKGVLRAKHGVFIFKDGTSRYDLTDLPLTHFRPREIGTSVGVLLDLGYTHDIHGIPLEREDQILELKVQDVVLCRDAGDWLLRVSRFVDDLLVRFYGLEPYYRAEKPEDLIGRLMIGLAPHTSAGVLCRLIGFTRASAGYAHPYFHAAKRRNCDGDEDCVMLLMDALLNFSRSYLPEKRGGKMDAPLVLTTRINPAEVDKEAHNLDLSFRYPLELYEASLRSANPKDVEGLVDLVSKRLGGEGQYSGFGFTHDTDDIAGGPKNSSYKTLETMIDKMKSQLELARLIRAVDATDVAERVINSHFLPDLMGNLRAFSRQSVRCVKCNAKYRRPPLSELCPKCGGKLVLTVHEGSVRKYLEVSMKVAEEYGVSSYTRQRLELIRMEIESLFRSDKVKQTGLADFV
ncbi:MAG: DNA polymerase II large subunit [Methanothrix sp.]|uniref:DNA polymerase II large subunit n=1 Tax=Methanothrix sp. TaxID=90426 RepID=UPI003D2A8C70